MTVILTYMTRRNNWLDTHTTTTEGLCTANATRASTTSSTCPSPFQILDTLTVSDSDSDTDVEKAQKLAEQVLVREEAEFH